MDGTSLTPEQEKLQALQKLLPEAFTEGNIYWKNNDFPDLKFHDLIR